jgi:hypothetical protein
VFTSTSVYNSAAGIYVDPITSRAFYVINNCGNLTGAGAIYEINTSLTLISGGTFSGLNSYFNTNSPVNLITLLSTTQVTSGLTTLNDGRGDLAIMPRRGSFFCYFRTTAAGAATLNTSFINSVPANAPYPLSAANVAITSNPNGWTAIGAGTTNGPRVFLPGSTMGYIKNMYTTTNISGSTTGRLVLKG